MTDQIIKSADGEHEKEVQQLVQDIFAAAYQKTLEGNVHVFANYSGHINTIEVTAHPNTQEYGGRHMPLTYLIKSDLIQLGPFRNKKNDPSAFVLIRQELNDLLEQIREL